MTKPRAPNCIFFQRRILWYIDYVLIKSFFFSLLEETRAPENETQMCYLDQSATPRWKHHCQVPDCQPSQHRLCKCSWSHLTPLPSHEYKNVCGINSLWYFQRGA